MTSRFILFIGNVIMSEPLIPIYKWFLLMFGRELFNKIAAEDMEFAHDEDSDFEIPEFGNATSDYEEVKSNNFQFILLECDV